MHLPACYMLRSDKQHILAAIIQPPDPSYIFRAFPKYDGIESTLLSYCEFHLALFRPRSVTTYTLPSGQVVDLHRHVIQVNDNPRRTWRFYARIGYHPDVGIISAGIPAKENIAP